MMHGVTSAVMRRLDLGPSLKPIKEPPFRPSYLIPVKDSPFIGPATPKPAPPAVALPPPMVFKPSVPTGVSDRAVAVFRAAAPPPRAASNNTDRKAGLAAVRRDAVDSSDILNDTQPPT